jgi:hypothetical protein
MLRCIAASPEFLCGWSSSDAFRAGQYAAGGEPLGESFTARTLVCGQRQGRPISQSIHYRLRQISFRGADGQSLMKAADIWTVRTW